MLNWVISIGLLGCYPYTHLVFYIYLVPSLMKNQSISFGGFYFSTWYQSKRNLNPKIHHFLLKIFLSLLNHHPPTSLYIATTPLNLPEVAANTSTSSRRCRHLLHFLQKDQHALHHIKEVPPPLLSYPEISNSIITTQKLDFYI